MPAFCAAIGSFQVKSPTTYFTVVFVTVRVLPFFPLTFTLKCSTTLLVSTLGARSYSDHRKSSMQISATRHSFGVSTGRTARLGSSFVGSGVNSDAIVTSGLGGFLDGFSAGCGGPDSGKAVSVRGTAVSPAGTTAGLGGSAMTVAALVVGTAAVPTADAGGAGSRTGTSATGGGAATRLGRSRGSVAA